MGPDRLRVPSAIELKKISQRVALTAVIIASSARPSDAQSTPRAGDLSNGISETHQVAKDLNQPSQIANLAGNTVSLAELTDKSEEKTFDLEDLNGGNQIDSHGHSPWSSDFWNKNLSSRSAELNEASPTAGSHGPRLLEIEGNEVPQESAVLNREKTLSRITGYYCEQIPGYLIGDGGGYCELTKMGIPVEPGIAACGDNYQLGSYIEIEGLGRFLCADRGYLSPDQIDIFFETNEQLEKSNKPDFARVTIVNNP